MFQCINESVTEADGQQNSSPIAGFLLANVDRTVSSIISLLKAFSAVAGVALGPKMEDEVRELTLQAQGLALQFGLHTSKLNLVVPTRGDQVQIGAEFHDCEDGDLERGKMLAVDLVPVPGLEKIGDGKSDLDIKRTIVPCEIFPELIGVK
jgi:hypothetical protein